MKTQKIIDPRVGCTYHLKYYITADNDFEDQLREIGLRRCYETF